MSRGKSSVDRQRQRELGSRVYSLRSEQRLKSEYVWRTDGVERSFISNLKSGIRDISCPRIRDLAEGLSVDLGDLKYMFEIS